MARASSGFTLIELMVVLAIIGIVSAIAYPTVSDTFRKLRARDGAKAVVNAVLSARAQATIRNLAHRVTLSTSTTVGATSQTGGGTITVRRASGASCTAAGIVWTFVESYDFQPLQDVNLCLVRTTTSPAVDITTTCEAATVDLCVTPDGLITNLGAPTAQNTIVYVREYENLGGTPTATGVVRQIVILRRKAVQVLPVQVANDACL